MQRYSYWQLLESPQQLAAIINYNVIVIHGAEAWLKLEIKHKLQQISGLTAKHYYIDSRTNLAELIDIKSGIDLFANRQLIIINCRLATLTTTQQRAWRHIMSQPQTTGYCFVIIIDAPEPAKHWLSITPAKTATTTTSATAVSVICEPLTLAAAAQWLKYQAHAFKLQLSAEQINYLINNYILNLYCKVKVRPKVVVAVWSCSREEAPSCL